MIVIVCKFIVAYSYRAGGVQPSLAGVPSRHESSWPEPAGGRV
jgi:hypothetical protein